AVWASQLRLGQTAVVLLTRASCLPRWPYRSLYHESLPYRSFPPCARLLKVSKTLQGRLAEPPLGDEVNRRIHSCFLLATRYWLEGEPCKAFTHTVYVGGEGASHSLCGEFIDGVAVAVRVTRIHDKQIAGTVKGQTLRAVRHRTEGRPTVTA